MKNKFISTLIVLFVGLTAFSQSIQLTSLSPDAFCTTGRDTMRFSVNYTNIPQNSNIVFYQSTNPAFNPYLGQGDSIGFINVGSNGTGGGGQVTTTCPEILGIFIDACNTAPLLEQDNEYTVITSGQGFLVNNLQVDLPTVSRDINIPLGSNLFGTPSAALMTQLRIGTCNTGNLFAAGPGDSIPPNAIVIIFSSFPSVGSGVYNYNFSSYCSSGQPIYILQNSFHQSQGTFANNAPGGCPGATRSTTIRNRSCSSTLVYNPCSLPVFDNLDPDANNGNYVIKLPGNVISSTTNGGIRNNAADKCNGLRFDSISGATIIKFPIPNDGSTNPVTNFCNTGYHYIKAITNPNGSQPVSNTLQYKLICLDVATNVNNLSFCSGGNAAVNISSTDPNATFSWSVSGGTSITGASPGTGSTINQTLNYSGATKDSLTYNITAIDGGCSSTTSVKVVVNKCTTCNAFNLGNDTTYCGPFTRVLKSGNATSVWSTGVTADSITVNALGTYYATCGAFTDTIKFTAAPGITFDFGANTTSVCVGGSISLGAGNTFDNYTWSTGASTNSITITQPDIYWVDVFKNGCKGSDTITVIQIDKEPKPNLGIDINVCSPLSQSLSTGNVNTTWYLNNAQVGTGATFTATQFGTYKAKVSNSCGDVYDTLIITEIVSLTKPNLGNDTTYCGSFTRNLTTGVSQTKWTRNNVAITTAATLTISQDGTYIASITNNCGTISDTIIILQNGIASKPFLGNDTTFCGDFSLSLVTGSSSTIWTIDNVPHSRAANITVTQGGTYVATVMGTCGNASDTIVIKTANALNVNLGRDTAICNGNSLTLRATVPGSSISYLWNTGAITPTISVNKFGKYDVTVSNGTCTVTDTIFVDVLHKPTIISLGNDTTICGDFSLQLFTGDAGTIWSTNAVGPQISVTKPATYIAENKNVCGSAKDTIVVTQFALPVVNLGKDTTICDSIILSVGNGSFATILWNTGDTTSSIIVNASGVYQVKVSNANCTNTDSVKVNKDCFYDVYIPSAFTPNGDGVNDVYVPLSNIKGMVVIDFVIFNRWGEKVFESKDFPPTYIVANNAPTDITKGWNGLFKGELAQQDDYVYFFTAKMPDDEVKIYKGTFALLR